MQLDKSGTPGTGSFTNRSEDSAAAPGFAHRVAVGVLISILVGLFTFRGLTIHPNGAADFGSALRLASSIVRHENPYSGPFGFDFVAYPLTAGLFGLPFHWLRPELAAAAFMGLSCGLLGFAITGRGWNRLLVFAAFPFWSALVTIQWSPLMMAAALLPWLYPVVIAKPNIGMSVALTSFNRTGAAVALGLTLLTLSIERDWPIIFWQKTRGFQNFIPIVGIGCVLLIALFRVRSDGDSRFLLLMGMTPQRWYYDAFMLWLIPATTAELLAAAVISWGAFWFTPPVRTIQQVAIISTVFNYFPMLAILLVRKWCQSPPRALVRERAGLWRRTLSEENAGVAGR